MEALDDSRQNDDHDDDNETNDVGGFSNRELIFN